MSETRADRSWAVYAPRENPKMNTIRDIKVSTELEVDQSPTSKFAVGMRRFGR